MDNPAEIKRFALARAAELGFCRAGIAPAERTAGADAYLRWLAQGRHASMDYLARNVEARRDIRVNFPWARSVLCLAASYAPNSPDADGPVARYARGRDYHKVLRGKCHRLADELTAAAPGLRIRTCVDTAPILERSYAAQAGLGWLGSNTCLIDAELGSYILLAEIVLSAELPADSPVPSQCGSCRLCMEACPTGALVAPGELDARKCLSWATIEHRGELDGSLNQRGQVFGCDICQSVCPYNHRVPPGLAEFVGPRAISQADAPAVLKWTRDDWDAATRGSAARRATYEMFLRNAAIAAGQGGLAESAPDLRRLAHHESPIVANAARWALRLLSTGGGAAPSRPVPTG